MILNVVFGTGDTFLLKLQDETRINNSKFFHPFLQCAIMFLGELFCLVLYKIRTFRDESPKNNVSIFKFAIPAFFDVCGSTCSLVGLTMCSGSIYQMMRGSLVIFTAVQAYVFLGRKQYFHHYVSIFFIFFALAMVGYVGTLSSNSSKEEVSETFETKPMGILILLVAYVFVGFKLISEEKLLQGYNIDPLQ